MHDPQKRSRYNNCSLCRGSLKKWLPIILPFGQTTPLVKRECLYLSSWIWDDFVVFFFTETHSRISERSFMGYQKPLFCCLGAQPSYCKDVWAVHPGGLQDVTWNQVLQVMAVIEAPNIPAPCQSWFLFSQKSFMEIKIYAPNIHWVFLQTCNYPLHCKLLVDWTISF